VNRRRFGMELQEFAIFRNRAFKIAGLLLRHGILNERLRILGAHVRPKYQRACQKREKRRGGLGHRTAESLLVSLQEKIMGWPKPSHVQSQTCRLEVELHCKFH